MKVTDLEPRVRDLLKADSRDVTDKNWVLAIYASLRAAEDLGYQRDEFVRIEEQERAQLEVLSAGILTSSGDSDVAAWRSGYFYNNALFRMAALAETGLNRLWRELNPKGSDGDLLHARWRRCHRGASDFLYKVSWYGCHFQQSLECLRKAHQQLNDFRHRFVGSFSIQELGRKLETMEDATRAFEELLGVLEKLVDATKKD